MKKIISLFFIIISIKTFAQNKPALSGVITDVKSGLPLQSASVIIPDLKLGVVTDSSGHYNFKVVPAGNYLVEVMLTGYKSASQNVMLQQGASANFKLEESFAENADVVVTGISKASQIKENPVPIVSVSHDYMMHEISTNAIDAIARIPGVSAVTTGPNISKPFIRGLGYNRILTLYDGVRQEGQQWGDEHGIEVDEYNVDHVEVIKGPASLSYGSDALAGVVNIIPTQAAPEGKIIGDATGEYQSNNRYWGSSLMLSGTKNGFEWLVRGSHKEAIDYENAVDGRVFGTAFNETDATVSLGLHKSWGYTHVNFILFNDLQEIPDGSRDSATWKFTRQIYDGAADTVRTIVPQSELNSYKIEPLHQHIQHYRVFTTSHFILGSGSLDLNLGFQESIRQEFSHPVYTAIPGLYLQLNSYTYDIKYNFRSENNWNITSGINGMYQQNTSTNGTEFVIPSYNQFDIGGFVVAKKSFGKLEFSGGARYDVRVFNNDELYTAPNPVTGFDMQVKGADIIGASKVFSNYSKTFSGVSGSIGATYNFSEKFSLKANISRGYRAPNIAEISANGVHPGTDIYQIGNPDFKPEFSLQEDVGGEFSSKYAEITLSVFNNTLSNYIYNQKLNSVFGGDSTIVQGNQTFKFQQGKANLYGGELSIDVHPVKKLHFENSVSVVYGDNKSANANTDSTQYLPFIPPLHGVSDIRYDFNVKHAHLAKAFVKAEMDYYATQNRVYSAYGTETRTPGYTLFGLGAGTGITNAKGKILFNIYVLANNIFNITYWDHLNRLKYFYGNYQNPGPNDNPQEHGIYNMGRNVSIKIDVPLSFDNK